jgi:hypothetical protein
MISQATYFIPWHKLLGTPWCSSNIFKQEAKTFFEVNPHQVLWTVSAESLAECIVDSSTSTEEVHHVHVLGKEIGLGQ